MSRWTNKADELERLSNIGKELVGISIVRVTSLSGNNLEGVVRRMSVGNNASTVAQDRTWLYYGNFDLQTIEGKIFTIDMLDVSTVKNVWKERVEEYRRAGLI